MSDWTEGYAAGIAAERKRCAALARAYAAEAREAQKYAMPGNSYGAIADRFDGLARAIEEGRQP